MSKYSGTDYHKYALVLELLGLAKRITDAGYHIKFVPGLDTYWWEDGKAYRTEDHEFRLAKKPLSKDKHCDSRG